MSKIRINGDSMVQCFPDDYEKLLKEKTDKLQQLMKPIESSHNIPIEIFRSPKQHFRMRANFNICRDIKNNDTPGNLYYGMFNESKQAVEITSFPRGSILLNDLMTKLMNILNIESNLLLRIKLFEIRFLTTSIQEAVIVLIYKHHLNETWIELAKKLSIDINCKVIGRSRKQKVVISDGINWSTTAAASGGNNKGDLQGTNNNNDDDDDEDDDEEGGGKEAILQKTNSVKATVTNTTTTAAAATTAVVSITAATSDLAEMIREELLIHNKPCIYYQTEGAFTQPNAAVCESMLEWSIDVSTDRCYNSNNDGDGDNDDSRIVMDSTEGPTTTTTTESTSTIHPHTTNSNDNNNTDNSNHKNMNRTRNNHDLLELYCGGGTFTIAMSPYYRQIVATEISKASVLLAHQAITANSITNIKIARLSSEEFTQAYHGERIFQRLQDIQLDFQQYSIRTVLVDPPRAGLDKKTCLLLTKFERIIYISCNPETLCRDLMILTTTHNVLRLAAFDQFPYTHHLECGVFLVKKKEDITTTTAVAAVTAVGVKQVIHDGDILTSSSSSSNSSSSNSVLGKRSAVDAI